jgi:hypothetical protein
MTPRTSAATITALTPIFDTHEPTVVGVDLVKGAGQFTRRDADEERCGAGFAAAFDSDAEHSTVPCDDRPAAAAPSDGCRELMTPEVGGSKPVSANR